MGGDRRHEREAGVEQDQRGEDIEDGVEEGPTSIGKGHHAREVFSGPGPARIGRVRQRPPLCGVQIETQAFDGCEQVVFRLEPLVGNRSFEYCGCGLDRAGVARPVVEILDGPFQVAARTEFLALKLRPHLFDQFRIGAGFRQFLKSCGIDVKDDLGQLFGQFRLALLFRQVAHRALRDLVGAAGDAGRGAHVGETEHAGQHHRSEEEQDEDEGRGEQNQAQCTGVAQHGGLPLLGGAQAVIRVRPHPRRNPTG